MKHRGQSVAFSLCGGHIYRCTVLSSVEVNIAHGCFVSFFALYHNFSFSLQKKSEIKVLCLDQH